MKSHPKTFVVNHAGHTIEVIARTGQAACRAAFRHLIKKGVIKRVPPWSYYHAYGFKNTHVTCLGDFK